MLKLKRCWVEKGVEDMRLRVLVPEPVPEAGLVPRPPLELMSKPNCSSGLRNSGRSGRSSMVNRSLA